MIDEAEFTLLHRPYIGNFDLTSDWSGNDKHFSKKFEREQNNLNWSGRWGVGTAWGTKAAAFLFRARIIISNFRKTVLNYPRKYTTSWLSTNDIYSILQISSDVNRSATFLAQETTPAFSSKEVSRKNSLSCKRFRKTLSKELA